MGSGQAGLQELCVCPQLLLAASFLFVVVVWSRVGLFLGLFVCWLVSFRSSLTACAKGNILQEVLLIWLTVQAAAAVVHVFLTGQQEILQDLRAGVNLSSPFLVVRATPLNHRCEPTRVLTAVATMLTIRSWLV